MDVVEMLQSSAASPVIHTIEMHTTGEPTRIIYKGYPELYGTLLEQRAQAKRDFDRIRQQLMLEPRGHWDMYGALLRQDTELVRTGEAHIGVLFLTNDGYSTMCGHATIALGRFLVDTHDLGVFPLRNKLKFDSKTKTVQINLHTPCGVVRITAPTSQDGKASDLSRPVSYVSVSSFATGVNVRVPLAESSRWPELASRSDPTAVYADFCYGGAFFCIISATEMGFPNGLRGIDLDKLNHATRLLKDAINRDPELKALYHHPDEQDLSFLYSIIVVESTIGENSTGTSDVETGICYFSDQQVDRSPTGSGVAARVALAFAKSERAKGRPWIYNSLVSNAYGCGAFVGAPIEEVQIPGARGVATQGVKVKVEGHAYYTGTSSFMVESGDQIGKEGFAFHRLGH